MGTVGSIFILLGIAFLYSYTSTLNLADMAGILTQKNASNIMLLVNVLFIMGFGLKCALVPFHAWLPDAHTSAPAPISAILSGVLIKSLGVYALIRIFFNVFGMTPVIQTQLMFLGALSMVAGGILCVSQWDFKRLLAYSSISQIGYIILGISLGTPLGILGGLFHLVNHSIFKPLLFLNAGAVEYATGTRDLNKMGGLASRMPLTRFTNLIGSSSISGIPPFNGFWSKLIIIIACVEAGRIGYALCAVLASILTLSAVIKAMKYAFYGRLKETFSQVKEVPFFMRLSMSILAAVCIVAGILLLPNLYEFFLKPAQTVLLSGVEYRNLILK